MPGAEGTDRRFGQPYSADHPVPTVRKYRDEQAARLKDYFRSHRKSSSASIASTSAANDSSGPNTPSKSPTARKTLDTSSELDLVSSELRKRMERQSKRQSWERAERVVTDPVTHLPVTIHDFTTSSLNEVDIDASRPQTARALFDTTKNTDNGEDNRLRRPRGNLSNFFPPPQFDAVQQDLAAVTTRGLSMSVAGTLGLFSGSLFVSRILSRSPMVGRGRVASFFFAPVLLSVGAGAACALVIGVKNWVTRKVKSIFDDAVWESYEKKLKDDASKHEEETTVWLNSLVGSIWPMVNPDLFSSAGDTLEDVMQASLPSFIRMVSVDDISQGTEPLRILGIRWLPDGAAAEAVGEDGSLASTNPETTLVEKVAQGMEAEEGDFINLEVAFGYRSRVNSTASLNGDHNQGMHLSLAFFLPGNIKVPVWVDLNGIVGALRVRLQLTPDPPFFERTTLTLLGQPKVDISCTPLVEKGLNIMDVPFLNNFVQSSVDAAMSQFVAPESMALNLKDILAGEDFKKDTVAVGIIAVTIKRAFDFRAADPGTPLFRRGSSDPYVSVGWAKFGKAIWSTRIMEAEMEPRWDETCFIPVTAAEFDVGERVRVQLWDSDRMNGDDDLGYIEVDLDTLMHSNGQMTDRTDGFQSVKAGDDAPPGKLEWSIGWFPKAALQPSQYEHQTYDSEIRSEEQLKAKVDEACDRKLRQMMVKADRNKKVQKEIEQVRAQELKDTQDAIMMTAPPPENYPSGMFSLQIHNITDLGVDDSSRFSKRKQMAKEVGQDDEDEAGGPSAYCTVLVNHRKVYKTRTKPHNGKPFFNASCERFVGDWRECEVYVSVQDARPNGDVLIGSVHLPLYEVFRHRSQVTSVFPLAGGAGHGKVRLSMVWRSVELQAPRSMLGWDCGTVEVQPSLTSTGLSSDLQASEVIIRTPLGSGSMYPGNGGWSTRGGQSLKLPVGERYANCVSIAFKGSGSKLPRAPFFGGGGSSGSRSGSGSWSTRNVSTFCILWLRDVSDDEEVEVELPVWRGDLGRACVNVLDQPGEQVGTVKLRMTFWAGLGPAHSSWTSGSRTLRDVVEVVTSGAEEVSTPPVEQKAATIAGSTDGYIDVVDAVRTDSTCSDDVERPEMPRTNTVATMPELQIASRASEETTAPMESVQQVVTPDKSHRRHRHSIQWKMPRTPKWMRQRVDGMFDRHARHAGVESEV